MLTWGIELLFGFSAYSRRLALILLSVFIPLLQGQNKLESDEQLQYPKSDGVVNRPETEECCGLAGV